MPWFLSLDGESFFVHKWCHLRTAWKLFQYFSKMNLFFNDFWTCFFFYWSVLCLRMLFFLVAGIGDLSALCETMMGPIIDGDASIGWSTVKSCRGSGSSAESSGIDGLEPPSCSSPLGALAASSLGFGMFMIVHDCCPHAHRFYVFSDIHRISFDNKLYYQTVSTPRTHQTTTRHQLNI